MKKKDLLSSFEDTQVIYLATADKSGQPFVRPVTLILNNGKFWIATGSEDKKMKQIAENQNFEFCVPLYTEENGGYYRINGKLEISKSLDEKKMIHQQVDFIEMFWKDPADKGYALLQVLPENVEYMKPGEMTPQYFKWKDLK